MNTKKNFLIKANYDQSTVSARYEVYYFSEEEERSSELYDSEGEASFRTDFINSKKYKSINEVTEYELGTVEYLSILDNNWSKLGSFTNEKPKDSPKYSHTLAIYDAPALLSRVNDLINANHTKYYGLTKNNFILRVNVPDNSDSEFAKFKLSNLTKFNPDLGDSVTVLGLEDLKFWEKELKSFLDPSSSK